jgi:hypothetical protein
MPRLIKSTWLVLLLAGMLAACATLATAVPTSTLVQPAPATEQPEPTQPALTPTTVPSIPGEQVVISVAEDNETFNATVTGNGEIGVILADTFGYNPLRWLPLIEALDDNEHLRMVTFAYRDEDATPNQDTRSVFDYLRAEGIDKVICVGAGYGSRACGYLHGEPEIAGMVLITVDQPSKIEGDFPKLFLTADTDSVTPAAVTQRVYEQSTEPKEFKSYIADVHGPALFAKADVGPQVLVDITDFINGIVNSP